MKIFVEGKNGELVTIGRDNEKGIPEFGVTVRAENDDDARELLDELKPKIGELFSAMLRRDDSAIEKGIMEKVDKLCRYTKAEITIIEKVR